MKRLRIYISGIVQGVGFRYFTKQRAREFGIKGYVRNLPNGRVLVIAEGETDSLDKFISSLREGPRAAVVKDLSISEEEFKGEFDDFRVI